MKPELKPCPRCSTEKRLGLPTLFPSTDGYHGHVTCISCNFGGPNGSTEEEAIKKWNEMKEYHD